MCGRKQRCDISIAVSVALLAVAWVVYDGLCRAVPGELWLAGVMVGLTTLAAWGCTELFAPRTTADWYAEELSREELVARLGALLGGVWAPRYRKAVNNKPRPKVKKAKCSGAHTSVHKVLEEERRKRYKTGNGT